MADNTHEGLFEDDDENIQGEVINLVEDDLLDPDDLEEGEEEYEDFVPENAYGDDGDAFEHDPEVDDPIEGSQETSMVETTIINDLLKAKGILDPKIIKYENEQGEIEEYDFYSLPYEDQLQILQYTEPDTSNQLSDHETEVVSFLREQNATLDDVLEYVKRKAIEDYERENSGKGFTVDEYTDDELFLADLKLNFEDLTEEQLQAQLEKELEYEDVYKKKIAKIRSQYVDLEIKEREDAENSKKFEEEEAFVTLSNNLIDAAVNLEDIGGLVLEDNDKNIILSTVLESDANGKSSFEKKLADPQMRFKAAWFVEKGDEAFAMIHEHYKKTIDSVRKAAYEKGKAEGSGTAPTKVTKTSFTRTEKQNNGKKFMSIDDLS